MNTGRPARSPGGHATVDIQEHEGDGCGHLVGPRVVQDTPFRHPGHGETYASDIGAEFLRRNAGDRQRLVASNVSIVFEAIQANGEHRRG